MTTKPGREEHLPYPSSQGLRLLFLCGVFVFGAVIGHTLTQFFGSDLELKQRLIELAAQESAPLDLSIWKVVFAYLRFPLLAFLLGFCSFPLVAVPILMAVQGFVLSFSASALVASLGSAGIPLVLVSLGLRSLITIVCTLIPAVWSFNRGTGNSSEKRQTMRLFCICFFALVIGVILELTVMPTLFSSALDKLKYY